MVSVGGALRQRIDGGLSRLDCLVPLVYDVEVGLSASRGEDIDNLLENRADIFGRDAVSLRRVPKLGDEFGEFVNVDHVAEIFEAKLDVAGRVRKDINE